ncbi:unnamed protein product [Absidia cylindrospora]
MVFPTASYSTKINTKFSSRGSSNKKLRATHPKVGPRHAPNIYDRIAAYDRAFQRCLKQDSKLSSWRQRMDEKGLPTPLIEGYQRSSSSWQHSLSSVSSDSTTCSSGSYTLNKTKNVYDIKPIKSIPVTSPSSPPPLSPPMPKPSVSRRIINRLSLSKSTKRQSSKVAPSATQSLQRSNNYLNNSKQNNYSRHPPCPMKSNSPPKPSLPRTSHLQPQKPSRLPLDRHTYINNSKNNYLTTDIPRPPSPPPSPYGIDDCLSQKRLQGVEHLQYQSSHYYHRHRIIVK